MTYAERAHKVRLFPSGARARFGMVADEVIRDPRISFGAKAFYSVLATYAKGTSECDPSHAELLEAMGCSEPTLRKCRDELIGHGVIRHRRRGQGRTDVYEFVDGVNVDFECETCAPDRKASYTQDRNAPCASLHEEEISKDQQQSAAAVERETKSDSNPAAKELQALGMPKELAELHVAETPELAKVLIPHFRERFARPGINSYVGYMRKAFADPGRYSFIRDAAGRWRPPRDGPPPGPDPGKLLAEQTCQRAEAEKKWFAEMEGKPVTKLADLFRHGGR